MSTLFSSLHLRDPQPMLEAALRSWGGEDDLWVFGYASLIWRPEFAADEQRAAVVHGWHRALEMRSRVNRGTPECPGLVFALVRGGSCRGMAYRIERARVPAELERLWAREMPTGVYDPKWLAGRTAQGPVRALAFTLARTSPAHTGPIADPQMLEVLQRATGRYGSTLDYLLETASSLRGCGIRDRDVERLVALARRHALVPTLPAAGADVAVPRAEAAPAVTAVPALPEPSVPAPAAPEPPPLATSAWPAS
jgi:glutathione-specific gamma-glutamylcyclotransferase